MANLGEAEQREQLGTWTKTQIARINERLKILDANLNKLLEAEKERRLKEMGLEKKGTEAMGFQQTLTEEELGEQHQQKRERMAQGIREHWNDNRIKH